MIGPKMRKPQPKMDFNTILPFSLSPFFNYWIHVKMTSCGFLLDERKMTVVSPIFSAKWEVKNMFNHWFDGIPCEVFFDAKSIIGNWWGLVQLYFMYSWHSNAKVRWFSFPSFYPHQIKFIFCHPVYTGIREQIVSYAKFHFGAWSNIKF